MSGEKGKIVSRFCRMMFFFVILVVAQFSRAAIKPKSNGEKDNNSSRFVQGFALIG